MVFRDRLKISFHHICNIWRDNIPLIINVNNLKTSNSNEVKKNIMGSLLQHMK